MYSHQIDKNVLPKNLKKIESINYNVEYPDSLIHISGEFEIIQKYTLPKNLLSLKIGYVSKIEKGALPETLKILSYKENVTLPSLDVYPQSLTHLYFIENYKEKIEKNQIPNTITHLLFGSGCWGGGGYNEKIDENVIPNSVIHLTISNYYNHRFEKNTLPKYLTHLIFDKDAEYNYKIPEDILPKTLKVIKIHKLKRHLFPESLDESMFVYYPYNEKYMY